MAPVVPSVLWRCWLGSRKGTRPVENWVVRCWRGYLSGTGCHCHSLSLASVKSRLVLPFWYWLTWLVPEKGPLNGCVCVMASICNWVVVHKKLKWVVIGCRLGADTSAELSAALGHQVGRLQQQIRLWLPVVWRQCWHPVQWYDSHAAAHRWQVSHTHTFVSHTSWLMYSSCSHVSVITLLQSCIPNRRDSLHSVILVTRPFLLLITALFWITRSFCTRFRVFLPCMGIISVSLWNRLSLLLLTLVCG